MPIGDVYRVADEQRMQGQLIVNTHHYVLAGGADEDTAETLALTFRNVFLPFMRALQSDQLSHQKIVVQKIFPLPVRAAFELVNVADGANAGFPVNITVAMVFKRKGALANRKNLGRIYLAGLPIDNYDQDTGKFAFDNSDVRPAALAGALDTQLAEGIPGGAVFEPALFNRLTGLTTLIESASFDLTPRNQRRRQLGIGA